MGRRPKFVGELGGRGRGVGGRGLGVGGFLSGRCEFGVVGWRPFQQFRVSVGLFESSLSAIHLLVSRVAKFGCGSNSLFFWLSLMYPDQWCVLMVSKGACLCCKVLGTAEELLVATPRFLPNGCSSCFHCGS